MPSAGDQNPGILLNFTQGSAILNSCATLITLSFRTSQKKSISVKKSVSYNSRYKIQETKRSNILLILNKYRVLN